MSFVAVAIGGAAVVGAGASIIGGNKAASAQKYASDQATAVQQKQLDEATAEYQQNRADLAPYREQGYTSLAQLGRGTQDGGEFNRNFTMADFQKDPGYNFRQSEGMRGVEASAAARGGILSGGTLKALDRYNQDFASGEYSNAYNRYNNDLTTRFNRLSSLAGTGQTATNTGISASEANTATQQAGAQQIAGNINAAGNARASSYVNTSNAIGSAANNVGQYFALKSFLPSAGGGGSTFTPTPVSFANVGGTDPSTLAAL